MKHQKARSGVWLHFTEVTVEGVKKAQCSFCPWQTVPNATRMETHMTVKHKLSGQPKPEQSSASSSSSPSSVDIEPPPKVESQPGSQPSVARSQSPGTTPAKKLKIGKVTDFLDRAFTAGEQLAAEREQALALVLNGQSYHSQEQPWTRAFLTRLRCDYKPL